MSPVISLCGLMTAGFAYFMLDTIALSTNDLTISIFLGVVQFSGGFFLLTVAARYIPAAEVALYSLSEAVFASLWVWLVVDEVPSVLTMAGATVVLIAVGGYGLINIRRN